MQFQNTTRRESVLADCLLARIFHTGSSRGAANPDADTTGGRETAVEAAFKPHKPLKLPRHDQYEISRLISFAQRLMTLQYELFMLIIC